MAQRAGAPQLGPIKFFRSQTSSSALLFLCRLTPVLPNSSRFTPLNLSQSLPVLTDWQAGRLTKFFSNRTWRTQNKQFSAGLSPPCGGSLISGTRHLCSPEVRGRGRDGGVLAHGTHNITSVYNNLCHCCVLQPLSKNLSYIKASCHLSSFGQMEREKTEFRSSLETETKQKVMRDAPKVRRWRDLLSFLAAKPPSLLILQFPSIISRQLHRCIYF